MNERRVCLCTFTLSALHFLLLNMYCARAEGAQAYYILTRCTLEEALHDLLRHCAVTCRGSAEGIAFDLAVRIIWRFCQEASD